jgi:hypothetical protein
MDITRYTDSLEQFRTTLYQNFTNQADTLMELVDAMCSTPEANSVAEYSLSPYFRRSYSMLYKAIEGMALEPLWLAHQLNPYLPRPKARPFWLLLMDVTPTPRPYAYTLEDRAMVYQPEVVKGKLPVTIGHQYSTVALGLEAEAGISASWVLPLMTERVATDRDKELVGMEQIGMLLEDEKLPFGQELTVEVADSSYSKPESLYAHRKYPNVVTIARSRGNRIYYHKYVPSEEAQANPGKGHPTWYGARFSLSDAETWHAPDETLTFPETSRRGKAYTVEVQAWHNRLMTGKTKPVKLPMHECPFTLVRIVRYDKDGNPAFKHPLWLIVIGDRREELTLAHIHEAYTARFDLEHFFRFGKQKMLMVAFQTPEVAREENWFQLTHIAYAQLWMARHLVHCLPRPWERNRPAMKQRLISPTLGQRDFGRIIRHFGTPARPPKPRNISPGRPKGTIFPKRIRHPVVVKRKIDASTA